MSPRFLEQRRNQTFLCSPPTADLERIALHLPRGLQVTQGMCEAGSCAQAECGCSKVGGQGCSSMLLWAVCQYSGVYPRSSGRETEAERLLLE